MEEDGLEDIQVETQPIKTYEDGIIDTASVISLICAAMLFWYIFYVVPKFSDIFRSLRVEIPLPTRFILAIARSPGLNLMCLGSGLIVVELLRRKRSAKVGAIGRADSRAWIPSWPSAIGSIIATGDIS